MKGLFYQEIKTLFKSPASISILIIPLILLIGLGFLLPSGWIVPSSITIGIVATVLLYFGGSVEEIKRTSFMKSVSLTKLNKFTFLSTKILFSIFISMFAVLWVLLFSWVFTEVVPFLAQNFENLIPSDVEGVMKYISKIPFVIKWENVQWAKILYAGACTIVVAISIAFLFVTFSKSSLSFYLMSFGYLLAMILFGGVVMPSFLISTSEGHDNSWFKDLYYIIPNFYTNNIMAEAFSGTLGSLVFNISDSLNNVADNGFLPNIVNASNTGNLLDLMDSFFNGTSSNQATEIVLNGSSNAEWLATYNAWKGWDGTPETLNNFVDEIKGNEIVISGGKTLFKWTWTIDLTNEENISVLESYVNSFTNFYYKHLDSTEVAIELFTGKISIYDSLLFIFGQDNLDLILGSVDQSIINVLEKVKLLTFVKILNGVIVNNSDGIHLFTNTLEGMFNTAGTKDYIVPWFEVVVFLGISTYFFKWT